MDLKTLSPVLAALVLAVGLVVAFGGDDEVGVPGVNLIPTVGLVQTMTPTTNVTLTAADSGKTYLIATGTTATLPGVRDGLWMRFQVSGSVANTNFIIDSAEGDNIEGSVIVAGAVVDCAAVDQINIVNTAENIGDFVEVYSDGTKWLIGASNALTTGGITCTDPS